MLPRPPFLRILKIRESDSLVKGLLDLLLIVAVGHLD